MLPSPENPTIPRVLAKIAATSSGSAIGPPRQSAITSSQTANAASAIT